MKNPENSNLLWENKLANNNTEMTQMLRFCDKNFETVILQILQ